MPQIDRAPLRKGHILGLPIIRTKLAVDQHLGRASVGGRGQDLAAEPCDSSPLQELQDFRAAADPAARTSTTPPRQQPGPSGCRRRQRIERKLQARQIGQRNERSLADQPGVILQRRQQGRHRVAPPAPAQRHRRLAAHRVVRVLQRGDQAGLGRFGRRNPSDSAAPALGGRSFG